MTLPFLKTHGLGNDFVVLDLRRRGARAALTGAQMRAIADRRRGVGCDQLILLEPPRGPGDAYMAIFNPDGSEAEACGNATRCVAHLLWEETGAPSVAIGTRGGLLHCEVEGGLVAVDMGRPRLGWAEIPLREERDTLSLSIEGFESLGEACAVSMGNPHCVFFVADLSAVDVAALGPRIETHGLFPARTNVGFVEVTEPDRLRMRVWERGAGLTLACGSGACAGAVAAARRGLGERAVRINLDGGSLDIAWRADDHVIMTGPVAKTFTGVLDDSLLGESP